MTRSITAALTIALFSSPVLAAERPPIDPGKAAPFIDEMVSGHGFDRADLNALLGNARYRQDIIDAITRPAEGMPWHRYRKIFLTDSRIQGGVEFWNEHAEILQRAQETYGVPPEIIVAIIGVESRYGKHTGKYRVVDSLATLGFYYPKRSKFFRSELEQFLLLTREENVDPATATGSYAGAMGKPQFISSSYRNYAVDFDGDGKRDLWNSTEDVIGSVANYFARHKWQPDQPVAAPASVTGETWPALVKDGYKPKHTVGKLRGQGVSDDAGFSDSMAAALLELETESGHEYWIALDNFYVITRYNHSPLYAMAVYQLGQEIRRQKDDAAS